MAALIKCLASFFFLRAFFVTSRNFPLPRRRCSCAIIRDSCAEESPTGVYLVDGNNARHIHSGISCRLLVSIALRNGMRRAGFFREYVETVSRFFEPGRRQQKLTNASTRAVDAPLGQIGSLPFFPAAEAAALLPRYALKTKKASRVPETKTPKERR